MIKYIKVLLLLLALFLAACAGIDTSVLDTAETLGEDNFSVAQLNGMGINMPSWVEMDPENLMDSDSVHFTQLLELKYGIKPNIDLALRAGVDSDIQSVKLMYKNQFKKEKKHSLAVVLGGGFTNVDAKFLRWGPEEEWDWEAHIDGWQVKSLDAQLISTWELHKHLWLSLAGRGSLHDFKTLYKNDEAEHQMVYHAGLRGNAKFEWSGLHWIWELGVEAPLSLGELHSVLPWAGTKLGYTFKH